MAFNQIGLAYLLWDFIEKLKNEFLSYNLAP